MSALAAPAARAQQGALPAAADLVAKYIAATGGEAAYARHSSIRTVGQFEMPAMGLKGQLEILQARPNLMLTRLDVPGMGTISTGYDGAAGWSVNPVQGPRVFEGKELDAARDAAAFNSIVQRAERIQSMTTTGTATFDGESCYRVHLVWKSGRETDECYSTKTGLMIATIMKQESPMGSLEVTTLMGDYKDFGGIKVPTRSRVQSMGQEQVLTISAVEYDGVDKSAFAAPPTIKTLLETRK